MRLEQCSKFILVLIVISAKFPNSGEIFQIRLVLSNLNGKFQTSDILTFHFFQLPFQLHVSVTSHRDLPLCNICHQNLKIALYV